MTRAISITNRHPRLRFSRPAVARAIALLDEQFRILPADLCHLTLPRSRLSSLKSRIKYRAKRHPHPKSKMQFACPPGELSLVFLTDPAIAKIHGDFMDDPTATDVITFEGNAMADLAGEICVSADTAAKYVGLRPVAALERSDKVATLSAGNLKRGYTQKRQAPARQESFAAELTLYVVHGWLHLAGYDDLQPAKKRRMRAAEARAMKLLCEAQAVPEFRLI